MISTTISTTNITSLSAKESLFLARLAEAGISTFTSAQARDFWSPSGQVKELLIRLVRKGWLRRLERGKYLVIPLEAGASRTWAENGWVIAHSLVSPAAIAYWSALHYWSMTEQIPRTVFIQTTRRKASVEIGGIDYRFVTVLENRFFGIVNLQLSGKPLSVTDREKTVIDSAARPDLCGGVLQLAQVLQNNHAQLNWDKLDGYITQWGGGVVVKRLGYLLETLKIPEQTARLERWQAWVKSGISLLEPGYPARGQVETRWQIKVNVPVQRNEAEQ